MPRFADTQIDPGESPTLEDLLRLAMRSQSLGLRVGVPARVVRYDPGPPVPFVEAAIALQRVTVDERRDGETAQDYPVIPLCPVEYPRGGGYRMVWGLQPGDGGWLKFSDRALEQWLDASEPVDPLMARAHHLADAVFVPGLSNRQDPQGAVPLDGLTIEREDGTASMSLDGLISRLTHSGVGGRVLLGEGSAPSQEFVARVTDATTPNGVMATWIAAVTALLADPSILAFLNATASGGPYLAPVPPVGAFGSITTGSAKVKAE